MALGYSHASSATRSVETLFSSASSLFWKFHQLQVAASAVPVGLDVFVSNSLISSEFGYGNQRIDFSRALALMQLLCTGMLGLCVRGQKLRRREC
jgi:hypothetical protein